MNMRYLPFTLPCDYTYLNVTLGHRFWHGAAPSYPLFRGIHSSLGVPIDLRETSLCPSTMRFVRFPISEARFEDFGWSLGKRTKINSSHEAPNTVRPCRGGE
jgi:hypothetical protein